jgi:preprotein translocase subunit SecY
MSIRKSLKQAIELITKNNAPSRTYQLIVGILLGATIALVVWTIYERRKTKKVTFADPIVAPTPAPASVDAEYIPIASNPLPTPVIQASTTPVIQVSATPAIPQGPTRKYNPGYSQQLGVLKGPGGKVLPLYGKMKPTRRNRFEYYTTSTAAFGGFPIGITFKGKECMGDFGCDELYGGEEIEIDSEIYTVELYRVSLNY